ncbi:MAG: TIM barrel protein [Phycisphaerae bacterium]|nr:TIM barrel protein [Phycisphaerae bacterium]
MRNSLHPFGIVSLICLTATVARGQATATSGPAATMPNQTASAYRPRVAVQLYVWHQDRSRRGLDLWQDLDAALAEVAASGSADVEAFLNWFDTDERAERTRRLLAKHKLRLVGAYHGGVFHDKARAREVIETIVACAGRAKACGPIFVDVNPDPLPGKVAKSDEQLATQVRMLNALGQRLAAMGLSLVVHQHDPEILYDAREHRYNVAHVDPAVVGFCLDLHWVYRGGQDPLTLLTEAGNRVRALHLRNSVNGTWTESLGPGDIDYKPIANYLRKTGFAGWLIVELAHERDTRITRSLVEDVRLSREYVEAVFLGSK